MGLPPRFQLVGFTTATVKGGEGVLGFALTCQQEFLDSRMCTSKEIMDTISVPILTPDVWAYVRPSWHGTASITIRDSDTGLLVNRPNPFDESGVNPGPESLSEEATCHGWARGSSGHAGLAVSSKGAFNFVSCASARPVACCALVR